MKLTWTLLACLCLGLFACAPTGPYVWVTQLPSAQQTGAPVLRPGDRVQVIIHGQDAMSGEVEVRPGGDLVLPVSGRFVAQGLTPEQLAEQVQIRLAGVLAQAQVTAVLTARRPASVSVLGEVREAGQYELREGEGVLNALARAGGLTAFAASEGIFVIRRTPELVRIRFRFADLAAAEPTSVRFELRDGDVVVVE
ncbi:MAG TPA: polysaccharide biosynthesis/export family protein [Polyangiaceae bacterium]|nr:polysaccharide biosynthesis/export family protein [Polyangiaceae bacterium]